MKVEKYENQLSRNVLAGMIVSQEALSGIVPMWETDSMFESPWENLVGKFCVKYFNEYGKAPEKNIESIFLKWVETAKDQDTISLVERFLQSLDGDYQTLHEDIDPIYTVAIARDVFEKVKVKKLHDQLQSDIDAGDYSQARERIVSFAPLPADSSEQVIDVLHDMQVIRDACEYTKQPSLISFPGGLGDFYGDSLKKGTFYTFTGIDKSAKSFNLLDMAYRAVSQRRRVLYLEAGDLTQNQTTARLIARIARRPLKKGEYYFPSEIIPGKPPQVVLSDPVEYEENMTFQEAWEALQRFQKKVVKSKERYWKLACYPNSSLQMEDVFALLKNLRLREGWIPDCVFIDYADILIAPSRVKELREGIDHIWRGMRRLSQEEDCLVMTATQADAKGYDTRLLTRANFSNDKRKNAHVDGNIGINPEHSDKHVWKARLNWIFQRSASSFGSRVCYCAGNLAVSNPAILSLF